MDYEIREVSIEDAPHLCDIYNYYVENTSISFEESPVSHEEMQSRIKQRASHLPWLVLHSGGKVLAYAYASPWRVRSAYRYSAESTVYVHNAYLQRGLGKLLYRSLIEKVRMARIRSLIGGIAMPNPASIALHESLGFKKVAEFADVGYKFDQWLTVGYWQLMLEPSVA